MNLLTNLSAQQLKRAAGIKNKIEALQKRLVRLLATTPQSQTVKAPRKKRKMSAAARKKISQAAKARWANINGKKRPGKMAPKAKRKISAAGLAKIRAAQKARWAKIKAAKK